MFQRLYTVALNTFVETVRQPLYGVILLTTAILLVLNVSLAAFTLGDDDKLLLDLGLSTLLLSGLFLSAFSAAGVLSREIENKTVLTVISKPVSRPIFLLGKFAGLIVGLGLAYYLATLAFFLTVRHGVLQNSSDPWDQPVLVFGFGSIVLAGLVGAVLNFFYDKDFPTTMLAIVTPLLTLCMFLVAKFGKSWEVIPFGSEFVGGQVVLAAFLVWLAVMVTAAVALAASTRLGQLMTLLVCTGVLAFGIISDNALGQYQDSSYVATAAYRALPNFGPFWVIDALHAQTEQTTIPFSYVGLVTAYASLMTAGILSIGIFMFQRREVG